MTTDPLPKHLTIDKSVGETPLEALERLRATDPRLKDLPMAYAGRLDPLASGRLLILIGDTCKDQEHYHAFDKEYQFTVLLGVCSDSEDVLGMIKTDEKIPTPSVTEITEVTNSLVGDISLPYPAYSAKTVKGIPLHTWAVTNKLNEIEIPYRNSHIYKLSVLNITHLLGSQLTDIAMKKIDSIPEVKDPRKKQGNNFRRIPIKKGWEDFKAKHSKDRFTTVDLNCVASSGTYMRSLAREIAKRLGTVGLALHIHRSRIGVCHLVGKDLVWDKEL